MKYVKINRCLQLALGGLVDTDVDCISNDAVSSPTYYQFFSSVFVSSLIYYFKVAPSLIQAHLAVAKFSS